ALAIAAIVRLSRRARHAATTPRERALVLGAMAAGLALLLQCLSDFPLHIPGVAITAVIVAAHLSRLGLEAGARRRNDDADDVPGGSRLGPILAALAMLGLSLTILAQGVGLARAEALVRGVGLPYPGSLMPT